MRQFFTTIILTFGLLTSLTAQTNTFNPWKPVAPESMNLPADAKRSLQPVASKTFQLDYANLRTVLQQAPMEFSAAAEQHPLMLDLPQADGSVRRYKVWESPIMAPELYAKYPEIRNYAGVAADGSGDIVRLGVGYTGFHAFMADATTGAVQSVRPYADNQQKFYMAYRLKDLPNDMGTGQAVACGVTDDVLFDPASLIADQAVADRGSAPVQLKKYRAAIAAKGEYTEFFGGTAQLALSAINIAMEFINMLLERDLDVRFEVIANNDQIIFLDKNTDPYTGDTVGDWMSQNPGAINPIIGVGSYDVGHVFAQYVTGNQVGVVSGRTCNNVTKGRGCSSASNPATEYFYLVAAHEMCHQLSGSHTWSNCPPNDDQLAAGTAYEPGSGSTIMSYAGSCSGGNNVQGDNDPYYHIASILQVQNFVAQGEGNTCGTSMTTTNNPPDATISIPNNLSIPILTPFQLTGSGSDPDGDPLTYCWEEYDLGPVSQLGSPIGNAPAFRSYEPVSTPTRIFPRLQLVLSGGSSNSEVLPDTTRNFTFRMTVRDNRTGGGGVDWAEIKFKSTYTAGPFRVMYPNTNTVTWNVGEYQTVTWDVANTDVAPVNCKTVNILLSTNAGNSFPIVLASGVPNIGRYCIQVPDNATSGARIRIEAADNIFFDVSNSNFKIQQPTLAAFSFCPASLKDQACLPAEYTLEISTDDGNGSTDPITFSATGLPADATATFTPNPVMPGQATTLKIDFGANPQEGTFDLNVEGTANGSVKSSTVTITVVKNDFSALALETPVNGAQNVDFAPTLFWNGIVDADKYEVQVASSPSFEPATILATNINVIPDSFKVPTNLGDGTVCYWRVRPINDCGAGNWTKTYVFVTRIQNCFSSTASDLPKIIPTSVSTVESKITISTGGAVSDVNVKKVAGSHQFFKELEVHLISPTGIDVLLFTDKCGGTSGNFNIGFDDSGSAGFPCPANNGNLYVPAQPLSAINGQDAAGIWTLRVKDNVNGSSGQLTAFELELCSGVALNAPFLVNNNLLQVTPGGNGAVSTDLLKVDDPNNGPAELTFTLMSVPANGDLRKSGSNPLQPGDQFTQADIDNGAIRYYDYGISSDMEHFDFSATDGEGGLVSGTFDIQPLPVGTTNPVNDVAFELAPNPAHSFIRLSVAEALGSDSHVTLFNAAGQQLRSWMLPQGATVLTLDIAGLPEGVYAVSVQNDEARGVKKIVVR
ncbi:MAG: cadherin-like domain-containing protein [Saprospiraceae bacterium]